VIKKHYTLTLDIAVTVRDFIETRPEAARSRLEKSASKSDQEWQARQARLYESLIAHPEVLEDLCRCYAIDSLDDAWMQALRKRFDVKEDEEVVLPAINSLPQSDQKYWETVLSAGLFPENSELIAKCFCARLVSARIKDEGAAHLLSCVVTIPPAGAKTR
jgi:hypothetical protein